MRPSGEQCRCVGGQCWVRSPPCTGVQPTVPWVGACEGAAAFPGHLPLGPRLHPHPGHCLVLSWWLPSPQRPDAPGEGMKVHWQGVVGRGPNPGLPISTLPFPLPCQGGCGGLSSCWGWGCTPGHALRGWVPAGPAEEPATSGGLMSDPGGFCQPCFAPDLLQDSLSPRGRDPLMGLGWVPRACPGLISKDPHSE